uniref:Nuclear factor 7, brain-like n=1 Tax=Callorhinchus milii TaxID=7868 RepID=A0A4W3GA66_CALMI
MRDLRQREEEILQRMETNLREIQSNIDSLQQEISELQTQMEKDGPIFLQEESARKRRQEENNLGDGGLKRLSEALRNPEFKIQVLVLQNHTLGDCGVKQLCEDLRNLDCKISSLWLSDIDLTTDCTEDLASALTINHSLTQLNLIYNNLGDCGAKRPCVALRNPECKIQRLELGGNKLGDCEVKRLCEALRNPECKIQSLWLHSNNLTADCTEDLTTALSTNHSLTELILNNNNLGDCGVKRLCEALRNPECKIQRLWLWGNSLTDGCTDDLVSALSTNRSLRILDLGFNSFTDGSVPALRRLIQTCTSLEGIMLWGNKFNSDGENQLLSLRGIRAELRVFV